MARRKVEHAHRLTLAELALTLTPLHLLQSLDRAIEDLRHSVEADAMSLYLANPQGTELSLAATQGVQVDAARIEVGKGPLGRVALPGLSPEGGFYTVTGYPPERSFAAVPLSFQERLLGLLVATWPPHHAALASALPLLEDAARLLSTTVLAGLSTLRTQVADMFRNPTTEPVRTFTHRLQTLSHAGSVALSLRAQPVGSPGVCSTETCPLRNDPQALTLTQGQPWPAPCQHLQAGLTARTCVPIETHDTWLGVLGLSYPEQAPCPPTRYLAMLQTLAHEAAYYLPAPAIPPLGTPPLRILCLGGLTIYREGERLPETAFRRKSARQLLTILLVSAGTLIHRDALCEQLWPGVSGDRGANRLHGAVHALRRALGETPCIQGARDRYGFIPHPDVYVDFLHFRHLTAVAQAVDQPSARSMAIESLELACSLYRGDLFEDDPYSEWCWQPREELRHQYLEALLRLAREWAAQGDAEQTIDYYRRALRLNPLREDVHRSVMRVLWDHGRRQEALAQYTTCVELLRRELDAAPMPETEQLHRTMASAAHAPLR